MIICIDPGHGGRDLGGGTCRYFREADWVLDVSLHQAALLRGLGHQVVLTRSADVDLSLAGRARIVRESGAQICLCNHVNNVSDPRAHGLEIFHSIHARPDLARAIADEILALGLIRPRSGGLGVVQTRRSTRLPHQDYYYMNRKTGSVQVALIEYGFASNPRDAKALHENREAFAEAALRGALKYLAGMEKRYRRG